MSSASNVVVVDALLTDVLYLTNEATGYWYSGPCPAFAHTSHDGIVEPGLIAT